MWLHWLLLAVFTCSALASCDPDWVAFQGSCYKLTPSATELNGSILESRWGCLQIGADLVKIKSEEEHVFLTNLLGTVKNGTPVVLFGVYIAAGDGQSEGFFQWFDGSPVGNRAKWRGNNPNNGGPDGPEENCVKMRSGYVAKRGIFKDAARGAWKDVSCLNPQGVSHAYLCQKSENNQITGLLREHSFRVLKEHYFAGHHMGNYTVTSYIQCLTVCLAQYSCLSANVRVSGPHTDNCILNNATLGEDRDVMISDVTDYVEPRDWIYYEVEYPAFRV